MKEKRFQKIYVEITNICNLKCTFCPDTKREKRFIEIDKFEKIIERIKLYTNLIYLHVKGEPLLHPQLKHILQICEDNGISVNITTNATLLHKNVETILQSKAIRQMNLSLHSINQNEINEIYNSKSYLETVLKTVKIISKKTNILISFRLWNIDKIGANDKNIEIIEALEKEYNIDNLMEKTKQCRYVKLDNKVYLNQDRQFIWPNLNLNIISETGKCFGLRNQIAILVNGDIVPCCLDQEADIKLGNIFENTIEEVLSKNISKEIIQGFEAHKLINPLCKRCGFRTKFGNK